MKERWRQIEKKKQKKKKTEMYFFFQQIKILFGLSRSGIIL